LTTEVHCLAQTADICGEGVLFHAAHNAVYWTDINRCLIHRLALASMHLQTWDFDQPVTTLLPTSDPRWLVVVLGGRAVLWNSQQNEEGNLLLQLPTWPEVRCNDAGVSPAGELWVGTMQNNVAADGTTSAVSRTLGALYKVGRDGVLSPQAEDILIANTVCWSPDDRTMLFADTLRNEIYRFPYDVGTDGIGRREMFASGPPRGLPDGSAIDEEGFLWNCRYGGGCLIRFAPDGTVDCVIEMPIANPTNCTFGGADGRTLFVTSAGEGKQDASPEDGGLFCLRTPVAGARQHVYRLEDD